MFLPICCIACFKILLNTGQLTMAVFCYWLNEIAAQNLVVFFPVPKGKRKCFNAFLLFTRKILVGLFCKKIQGDTKSGHH